MITTLIKTLRDHLKWENIFFLAFAIPLITNPWGSVNPSELAKVSFLMAFVGVAFFVLALKAIFESRLKDSYSWPVAIGFCLLLLLLLYSTIFSTAPLQSFWGTYERLQGLTTRLLVMVFFLFCLRFFQTEARQKILWEFVKGVGLFVAIWGIVQYFTQDASTPWSSGQLFAGRIFGTLGNPNDFGQFLIFPLMAAFISLIETKSTFGRSLLPWVFNGSCLVIIGSALLLSQNRASILAVLVASALYLILKIKSARFRWAIFLAFIVAMGLFTGISLGNSRSMKTRLILWQSTIAASLEHPWLGTGLESFTQSIQKTLSPELYKYERLSQIPDHPHNGTLAILTEQGMVGLSVYAFILALIIIKLSKRVGSKKILSTPFKIAMFSLLATLITTQFGFNLITQDVFVAASLSIVVLGLFEFKEVEWPSGLLQKIFVAVLFLAPAIVLIGYPIRLLRVDNAIDNAVVTTLESRDRGLMSFQRLIEYSPPFAYLYRTVFIFFGQDLDFHRKDYDTLNRIHELHAELTNNDFESEAESGTLAYARGDLKGAVSIFESTLKKTPSALRVYELWASLAYKHQDYASAFKASDAYISIAPPYWRYGDNLENHTSEEREQYRIFMKSNGEFLKILEINKISRDAIGHY